MAAPQDNLQGIQSVKLRVWAGMPSLSIQPICSVVNKMDRFRPKCNCFVTVEAPQGEPARAALAGCCNAQQLAI